VSFKWAQERGGSVRKGKKATHVYFFKLIERKERTPSGEVRTVRIPLICAYPVFTVNQCEGVRVPQQDTRKLTERLLARLE
jgi:antirestriction protein ArdC